MAVSSPVSNLLFVHDLSVAPLRALQAQAAEAANLPVAFDDRLKIGGQGPRMRVIPPGVFEMGSPADEFGHRPEEGPLHYQQMAAPFAIGQVPVTADEFARFSEATGWVWRSDLIRSHGRHPVINVRHGEAEDYCHWLSEQTGQHYRLPSEAEWEYACRAGTLGPFAFGDNVSCKDVHFKAVFPYEEAKREQRFFLPKCAPIAKTVETGCYQANAWGLQDMHGNVWEMTSENWRNSYSKLPRRHPAPVARRNKWIVVRGGSWFDAAVYARSAARRPRLRDELDVNLGFRVVREI